MAADKKKKSIMDFVKIRQIAESPNLDISRLPTGLPIFDVLTEGGIPVGGLVEIAGEPGTLKTTLSLMTCKRVLDAGGKVLYIDLENTLNARNLAHHGISMSDKNAKFHHMQMEPAEVIFDLLLEIADKNTFDLVVVDSVAALSPRAELEGEMGDANVAIVARLLSKFGRRIQEKFSKPEAKTTFIFINQYRSLIGNVSQHGPNKTTIGGRSMNYYAQMRINLIRMGQLKTGDNVIGSIMKFDVIKSRTCQNFVNGTFDFNFRTGIDLTGNLIDMAVDQGLVRKSGAWYYVDGESFQGKEKTKAFLEERANVGILDGLKDRLFQSIKSDSPAIVDFGAEEVDTLLEEEEE